MPANVSNVSSMRDTIHPLFDQSRFSADFDFNLIAPACLLASRLLDSPQGLHAGYAFFFGIDQPAERPSGIKPGRSQPRWYACNKGVGELSEEDIQAVQEQRLLLAERVRFELHEDATKDTNGTAAQYRKEGVHGTDAKVYISRPLYEAILTSATANHKAVALFGLANVLIHEASHAAHNHIKGWCPDDFCEEEKIAEAGYHFESSIFGMMFAFRAEELIKAHPRVGWSNWQNHGRDGHSYHLCQKGRDIANLPMGECKLQVHLEFVTKLLGEDFWEGEYLERGAVSLIPAAVVDVIQTQKPEVAFEAIPKSVLDLFRRPGGSSYASREYRALANPGRVLRQAELPEWEHQEMMEEMIRKNEEMIREDEEQIEAEEFPWHEWM